MAKKTAKKPAAKKPAAKTTTNRPPLKVTRGSRKAGGAGGAGGSPRISAFSGAGKTGQAVQRPGGYGQRTVRLFTGGSRKKPTMMAAKKGSQIFLDKKGKKTTMDKAATKGGALRKGFQMVLGEGTRNRTVVTAGESE